MRVGRSGIKLTILAAGWKTCICFKMVAPSLVIVTSPFPLWICSKSERNVDQREIYDMFNEAIRAIKAGSNKDESR